MLWQNTTNVTQLVYDTYWNPYYLKPNAVVDDAIIPTEKLMSILQPRPTKPVIVALINGIKPKVLACLHDLKDFDVVPLSINWAHNYRRGLDEIIQKLAPVLFVVFDDGESSTVIPGIKEAQQKHYKVVFLQSTLLQHRRIRKIYSDVVITYGTKAAEVLAQKTNATIFTANYIYQEVHNKLTKTQRDSNKTILIIDNSTLSQANIQAIRDSYHIAQTFLGYQVIVSYRYSSPQLSAIPNQTADLSKASVVLSTPSFQLLYGALLNLPVIKLDYGNAFENMFYNATNKKDLQRVLPRALRTTKTDLTKQHLIVNELCNSTTSLNNIFNQIL